jgi:small subunit ribosomal protein S20
MPNTESAKRALRKMHRRRARNRVLRSSLRTTIKKIRLTAEQLVKVPTAKDDPNAAVVTPEAAVEQLRLAIKQIDQSCAKGLIHKNKASRDKSRLTVRMNKAIAAAAAKSA